ncbi:MAG: TlpA family protein disulfide reductase [Deltaproteobacteria bacterium]|nr:TlpA family protein disulfide reductase [Deltaproteobacteria bacterium]
MKRSVRLVVAAGVLQAALAGVYFWVEGAKTELGRAPPERVEGLMRPLSLRAHDGTRRELRAVGRATLVHFWATWCPPCRTELPGLLAIPEKYPIDVVAIALDRDWSEVERFWGGHPPATVFLGNTREAEAAFGVRALPVTYLIEPGRRLRLRFDGARNWGDPALLKAWAPGSAAD